MAFDNRFIDELKMNINIVDVVGKEVSLKKSGSNHKGLCPFHSEKTPSFMVNEEKQIFNCFGCGEKGDVIRFVQRFYNLSFMDAVDKLCEEYGIKRPDYSGGKRIDYDKYYEINAKAARFFYKNLTGGPNIGYSYLKGRGLTDHTIASFGLGYAPDSWNSLTDHLRKEGVSDADMVKLGLASEGKKGIYDKFRDRVMFPIFSTNGKVIGFGGRAIGDIKPKYLNSPESEIFLKKNNLYALNFTKKDISERDHVIMVEGYMDVISLFQSGVRNVAASLGTALTDNQAKLISRYTKNVVLSYDSDNAGIKAALRGISIMKGQSLNVKVLTVDDGKDPDEFVKKHGREAFERLVKKAVPGTEFRLNALKVGYSFDNDTDVLDYINRVVPVLRNLNPVEQNIYIKKLSDEFGLSESSITAEVHTGGGVQSTRPKAASTSANNIRKRDTVSDDRDIRLEMSLLILAVNNTRYLKCFEDDSIVFRSGRSRNILAAMNQLCDDAENGIHSIELNKIFALLDPEDEEYFRKFTKIIKIGPDDEAFYHECRTAYKINALKDKRLELLQRISVSEKMGSSKETAELGMQLVEINNLIKETMEDNNA